MSIPGILFISAAGAMIIGYFTVLLILRLKYKVPFSPLGISNMRRASVAVEILVRVFMFMWLGLGIAYSFGFETFGVRADFMIYLNIVGAVFMGLGIALFLYSMLCMKESYCGGIKDNEASRLVVTGIFSKTRNPVTISLFIILAASCLVLPFELMAMALIVNVFTLHAHIKTEERVLRTLYSEDYTAYAGKTPRYL